MLLCGIMKGEMVMSRGVGNSIIPIRLNNRPEVVLVELRYELQQDSRKAETI